jgi:hypothetical protein
VHQLNLVLGLGQGRACRLLLATVSPAREARSSGACVASALSPPPPPTPKAQAPAGALTQCARRANLRRAPTAHQRQSGGGQSACQRQSRALISGNLPGLRVLQFTGGSQCSRRLSIGGSECSPATIYRPPQVVTASASPWSSLPVLGFDLLKKWHNIFLQYQFVQI